MSDKILRALEAVEEEEMAATKDPSASDGRTVYAEVALDVCRRIRDKAGVPQ